MRRGREVRQLDLAYPESSLTLEAPPRQRGILAGDRAPDAPLRGRAGQSHRLFQLLQGGHWTLLGIGIERGFIAPRAGLRIHAVGAAAELDDESGHFAAAYGLARGECVLVRPDGYIGALVHASQATELENYFERVGLQVSLRERQL